MIKKYYSCTLLSDIILNSSLATEGNMQSLDYIQGSSIWGSVASKLYQTLPEEEVNNLIYRNNFSDALPHDGKQSSYPMPLIWFKDKLSNNLYNETIFHHLPLKQQGIKPINANGSFAQLKQCREGYILNDGTYIKELQKNTQIKSARDRRTGASADGKMFAFEALEANQKFIFSVSYSNIQDLDIIHPIVLKINSIGKSKSAQYGKVKIEHLTDVKECNSVDFDNKLVLVYFKSNTSFTNDMGMPTYQPSVQQLGLDSGEIKWEYSQVRPYTYSTWNNKRNTQNTQRFCIAKGSVIVVENVNNFEKNHNFIGDYQHEGLGEVIYNPSFLNFDKNNASVVFKLKEQAVVNPLTNQLKDKSPLINFLIQQKNEHQQQLELLNKVSNCIKDSKEDLNKITKSQWGEIRKKAINAKDSNKLLYDLFGVKIAVFNKDVFMAELDKKINTEEKNQDAYLLHGVAYTKYWSKNNYKPLKKLAEMIAENYAYGTSFVIKFCSEKSKTIKK